MSPFCENWLQLFPKRSWDHAEALLIRYQDRPVLGFVFPTDECVPQCKEDVLHVLEERYLIGEYAHIRFQFNQTCVGRANGSVQYIALVPNR